MVWIVESDLWPGPQTHVTYMTNCAHTGAEIVLMVKVFKVWSSGLSCGLCSAVLLKYSFAFSKKRI
jgi:hypothetical protein